MGISGESRVPRSSRVPFQRAPPSFALLVLCVLLSAYVSGCTSLGSVTRPVSHARRMAQQSSTRRQTKSSGRHRHRSRAASAGPEWWNQGYAPGGRHVCSSCHDSRLELQYTFLKAKGCRGTEPPGAQLSSYQVREAESAQSNAEDSESGSNQKFSVNAEPGSQEFSVDAEPGSDQAFSVKALAFSLGGTVTTYSSANALWTAEGAASRQKVMAESQQEPGLDEQLQDVCPRTTLQELASELLAALEHSGYSKTAKFLEASGLLLQMQGPGTFLAPVDSAYDKAKLPSRIFESLFSQNETESSRVSQEVMRNHMLRVDLSYHKLVTMQPSTFRTYYSHSSSSAPEAQEEASTQVQASGFCKNGKQFVVFEPSPRGSSTEKVLLVDIGVFCNKLAWVHGVDGLFVPHQQTEPAAFSSALRADPEAEGSYKEDTTAYDEDMAPSSELPLTSQVPAPSEEADAGPVPFPLPVPSPSAASPLDDLAPPGGPSER